MTRIWIWTRTRKEGPIINTGRCLNPRHLRINKLGNDLVDSVADLFSNSLATRDMEFIGIQTELMKKRRMNIRDVMSVLDSVKSEFVGCAVRHAALDAATGHPYGEAKRMMIAPVLVLRARRTTEFGGPHHQGLIEQPSLLQVFE